MLTHSIFANVTLRILDQPSTSHLVVNSQNGKSPLRMMFETTNHIDSPAKDGGTLANRATQ